MAKSLRLQPKFRRNSATRESQVSVMHLVIVVALPSG